MALKRCLTVKEKQIILKSLDAELNAKKLTMKELAQAVHLPRSTVATILRNRRAIEATPASERHRFRARNKKNNPNTGRNKYETLEKELGNWVNQQRNRCGVVRGTAVRKRARELAEDMQLKGFSASNGWLARFSKKHRLSRSELSKPQAGLTVTYCSEDWLHQLVEEKIARKAIETAAAQYLALTARLGFWEHMARSEGIHITRTILKDMALALAGVLGVTKFTASNGWMDKYQKQRAKRLEQAGRESRAELPEFGRVPGEQG